MRRIDHRRDLRIAVMSIKMHNSHQITNFSIFLSLQPPGWQDIRKVDKYFITGIHIDFGMLIFCG